MHTTDLPEGYRLVHSIDLQKNKKSALLVNIGGLAIAAAMIVPAAFFAPIPTCSLWKGRRMPS